MRYEILVIAFLFADRNGNPPPGMPLIFLCRWVEVSMN